MRASSTTSKNRGRKTILDAELEKQICDLLANGNTIRTVVGAVGISERVYFEWVERNPHFAQATTRARANAKASLTNKIVKAAPRDWKAAAWLLERMFPKEYGRSTRDDPEPGKLSPLAPPTIIIKTLSDSESRRLIDEAKPKAYGDDDAQ